jgi:hypothetical protein
MFTMRSAHCCIAEPFMIVRVPISRRKDKNMDGQGVTSPADLSAEFRRQLRSGPLRRFVSTLAPYAVQPELPERLLELLREIDRAAESQVSLPR